MQSVHIVCEGQLFIHLEDRGRETERDRSPMQWVTPQIPTIAECELDEKHKPRKQSRSPSLKTVIFFLPGYN